MRPKKLNSFIGKESITESLKIAIISAIKNKTSLDHVLLFGPPGVGKTTLAQVVANEMNSKIKIIQSTNINTVAELISLLSSLRELDILFIDEIHSLNKKIAEILYPALEDNVLDIVVGKTYNSQVIRMKLPKFTLIAATTSLGSIERALEERFGYIFFLSEYDRNEIEKIINNNLKKLNILLNEFEINEIINNCRGIPRNAIRIIKRINNHKTANSNFKIQKIIKECGYIFQGSTEIDINYLLLLNQMKNTHLGINTIIQALNIDEKTIIQKIEPFLIRQKYIYRNQKGRCLSENGKIFIENYLSQINA